MNAVKVYEYLSAGLPVLSADLDREAEFQGLVEICRTKDDWRAGVERALANRPESERARRRSFAARNLWSERARVFHGIIEQVEAARG
jgi:hypothetical protein